ncbi:MAG: NAD(P)H-hydrate epimerase [Candidatus Thorarchaeota archaeon]
MGLPGLTKEQMIKIDELMMSNLNVPVEFMMEHAGHNLARLSTTLCSKNQTIIVITGSGNNGGGGLVSACRLKGWGYDIEVYLPQGVDALRLVPKKQALRAESLGIELSDGLPTEYSDSLLIDAYLGYGYTERNDSTTKEVLNFLNDSSSIVSLDIPSGMDSNTGKSSVPFSPKATMTIAFVKEAFLKANRNQFGRLYVADIGVPMSIIENQLGIEWMSPYSISELKSLYLGFIRDPLQEVFIENDGDLADHPIWIVS